MCGFTNHTSTSRFKTTSRFKRPKTGLLRKGPGSQLQINKHYTFFLKSSVLKMKPWKIIFKKSLFFIYSCKQKTQHNNKQIRVSLIYLSVFAVKHTDVKALLLPLLQVSIKINFYHFSFNFFFFTDVKLSFCCICPLDGAL